MTGEHDRTGRGATGQPGVVYRAVRELSARLRDRHVIASISGGKDSAAMSLWLTEQGIEHERVFADTGWEADETYAYVRGPLTQAIGPIHEVRAEMQMEELILHKGMFPSRTRRFCTKELKLKPLAAFVRARAEELDIEVVNAVGIRREESATRAGFEAWEWCEDFDAEVWRPLLDWSLDDVIAIHRRHGLAPNPLYLRGATRVGCWPCIYASKEEVRLVADTDPTRIARIRELEVAVTRSQRERNGEPEEGGIVPSFFGLWIPEKKTRECRPIDQVVGWSRTAEGGRNLALFNPGPSDEGCMRWGLCEGTS